MRAAHPNPLVPPTARPLTAVQGAGGKPTPPAFPAPQRAANQTPPWPGLGPPSSISHRGEGTPGKGQENVCAHRPSTARLSREGADVKAEPQAPAEAGSQHWDPDAQPGPQGSPSLGSGSPSAKPGPVLRDPAQTAWLLRKLRQDPVGEERRSLQEGSRARLRLPPGLVAKLVTQANQVTGIVTKTPRGEPGRMEPGLRRRGWAGLLVTDRRGSRPSQRGPPDEARIAAAEDRAALTTERGRTPVLAERPFPVGSTLAEEPGAPSAGIHTGRALSTAGPPSELEAGKAAPESGFSGL